MTMAESPRRNDGVFDTREDLELYVGLLEEQEMPDKTTNEGRDQIANPCCQEFARCH